MGCGKLTGGWVRVKEAAAVYTEERVGRLVKGCSNTQKTRKRIKMHDSKATSHNFKKTPCFYLPLRLRSINL
jgi:hypothetical protein